MTAGVQELQGNQNRDMQRTRSRGIDNHKTAESSSKKIGLINKITTGWKEVEYSTLLWLFKISVIH